MTVRAEVAAEFQATALAMQSRQRPVSIRDRLRLAMAGLGSGDEELRAAIARFLADHDTAPAAAGAALQETILRRCTAAPTRHAWQDRADLDG
ncbi:hypothetical protein [Rhodovulum sulfidophilum]|uniref:Uncharacterized protein n=1 Tax=Rhodovulum sulfidophilum TaxID=35806 RepID=A0A0D6AXN9_RHOSU|nr:hypothetical protein [Rhodovulum sulfidophilum]MBL3575332.1 hypothetical protein [Rhodovulum sulfidophilum]MCE8419711.1 hypothetical protein [Rhodovulum sulfidophilum]MCE8440540.1 hypothetical protein [Rhodovulum sulfidophilum]MCF4115760.1 hypothetical protein [Rhodovulum sulfidophilum]OLS53776.1 hypothetical protein BV392_18500 [Rhodovulum sulfidophilum]